MQPQVDIANVLRVIDVPPATLNFIKLPYHQAVQGLADFKSFIRTKKKELAKKYAPRKIGDDEQRMKEINQAIDLLMGMEVVEMRPMPVMYTYTVHAYNYAADSGATTSTVSSWA